MAFSFRLLKCIYVYGSGFMNPSFGNISLNQNVSPGFCTFLVACRDKHNSSECYDKMLRLL